jgi:hypothetical protein
MGLTSTLSFQAIVIWSSTSLTVFDGIKQCRRITTRYIRDARRRSQRAAKSECAGGAARENGRVRLVKALAAKDGERPGRGGPGHLVFLEAPARYSELRLGFLAAAP